ncbi:hypothetical protein [Acidovorax sp. CCYZU-2555]|uniref:hypothetical protein n=1 Tax=Acidovorax sp. CCYZU-2555 TaxID=2835042 RepID=UPI001BCAA065|nr:hypothetical protein [Acidovorax sp. CCYZU-2555]MBS7779166.1 hypothetical protein [Acidovorax sp. CCYZU-2555]
MTPSTTSAPAPSGLAIRIGDTWIMLDDLDDEDQDQDADDYWNDTIDYAAHPGALNPFVVQPLVYPSECEDDKDFAALVAFVQGVKGLDA